ncbi:MAG: hypothetical protein Q8O43_06085 [Dehalococcoidia bacterium]|nr:hypothetical protein [Dehalococcoidia bacterium]
MEEEIAMSNPTQQEILHAIDQGIRNAQRDYLKAFQSDIASRYAPEYLMTMNIFQSLFELVDGYGLALEVPVYDIEGSSYTKFRGRKPGAVRLDGKCDLVLFNSEDKSRVVIEIKKDPWAYHEDMIRLIPLLKLGIEFSVFASCLFKKTEGELIEETQCLLDTIKNNYVKSGVTLSIELEPSAREPLYFEGDNEEWVWCPVIIKLQKIASD